MSMTPEMHIQVILSELERKLPEKYRTGQIAHGGYLWEKPGMLKMAEDELIDHVTYHFTLRHQIQSAFDYLVNGDVESAKFMLTKILSDPIDK